MNASNSQPRPEDTEQFLKRANASTPTPAEGAPQRSRPSAKQRRKAEQRKQLITMLSILALVVVIVGAVLGVNWWQNNREGTLPEDQRVVAVVGDEEVEIPPYSTCEIDDPDCKPGKPFELDFKGQDEVTLRIPEDVYDHDWAMLSIFDDPGANDEQYHKANETTETTVRLKSEKKKSDGSNPELTVVEIHSLLVGRDADGEETPVATVWAISPAEK